MSRNRKRAQEREAKLQKAKKRRLEKSKKLRAFTIQLNCGCCDAEVFFSSTEAIDEAFVSMGLTSTGVITDEVGQTVEGVDTFYGYRQSDEPRRNLTYLLKRLAG